VRHADLADFDSAPLDDLIVWYLDSNRGAIHTVEDLLLQQNIITAAIDHFIQVGVMEEIGSSPRCVAFNLD